MRQPARKDRQRIGERLPIGRVLIVWGFIATTIASGQEEPPARICTATVGVNADIFDEEGTQSINDIFVTAEGVLLAVGGHTYVRRSVDGGATWNTASVASEGELGRIAPQRVGSDKEGTLYWAGVFIREPQDQACRRRGIVTMRSRDFGETWHTVEVDEDCPFANKTVVALTRRGPPGEVWILISATQDSNPVSVVQRSLDGGDSWETMIVVQGEGPWGLAYLPSGAVVLGTRQPEPRFSEAGEVLGYPTIVRTSHDSGLSWERSEIGLHARRGRSLAVGDNGRLLIGVGESGDLNANGTASDWELWVSDNDGRDWMLRGLIPRSNSLLRDIAVGTDGAVSISGIRSLSGIRNRREEIVATVFRSFDGGSSWCALDEIETRGFSSYYVHPGFDRTEIDSSGNVFVSFRNSFDALGVGDSRWVVRRYSGGARTAVRYRRGDANDDEDVNISDAVFTLVSLFRGGTAPSCASAANTNGDSAVNITDAVYLLSFLFLGGPAPPAPFPECGTSDLPTDEELGCAESVCP